MTNRYLIATVAAFGILSAPLATAQSTFGSIVGVVRDPTQSVVPGATVTLRSLDDNNARTGHSRRRGRLRVCQPQAGRYSLTAKADGFLRLCRFVNAVRMPGRLCAWTSHW